MALDPDQVEVIATFIVAYPATCAIDWDHKVKVGQRAGKLARKDNPMIPVPGSACQDCLTWLPKAKVMAEE